MKYSVKWRLADLHPDKPVKVFTTFSCGGGSSMGYKRAGFQVIGNCEIDPKINELYQRNHHPKYNFCMDIRELVKKEDLPEELYGIDILDGSPPCSTFSMAGDREKAWGKKKVFREGQKEQTLDDLFFTFLDLVEKLKPKAVVAENVTGLLKGNAKGYVNLIIKRFKELGYNVQIFLLNSAFMDVPQRRERVFFIANRMGWPKLKIEINEPVIPFGKIRTKDGGRKPKEGTNTEWLIRNAAKETNCSMIQKRLGRKLKFYNQTILHDNEVPMTLTAGTIPLRACDGTYCTVEDITAIQTFPVDYDYGKRSANTACYVCGMSVPPNMMAHIADVLWSQWFQK
ncbi:MAG: DNA (cytosine-5-)-methyltransferase [Phascolarctobacterium sp.]|nr:DNA (cytosine-5-)-methyltransferase [Candidatus Phascolarctobacterium caballi]